MSQRLSVMVHVIHGNAQQQEIPSQRRHPVSSVRCKDNDCSFTGVVFAGSLMQLSVLRTTRIYCLGIDYYQLSRSRFHHSNKYHDQQASTL